VFSRKKIKKTIPGLPRNYSWTQHHREMIWCRGQWSQSSDVEGCDPNMHAAFLRWMATSILCSIYNAISQQTTLPELDCNPAYKIYSIMIFESTLIWQSWGYSCNKIHKQRWDLLRFGDSRELCQVDKWQQLTEPIYIMRTPPQARSVALCNKHIFYLFMNLFRNYFISTPRLQQAIHVAGICP